MTAIQFLVALFGVLMALDVVQTYFFPRFGLKEGNPWLAKLMAQEGFDALVFAKYVVFLAVFAAAGQGWVPIVGMWIVITLQAIVIGWNAYKMIGGR